MKKLISGVVCALVAVTLTAVAWDDQNRTIDKLQAKTITAVSVTASGAITGGSLVGAVSAASLTAGTAATAINGAAITNLTAANVKPAGTTIIYSNVAFNAGATTGTLTFVNGRLVNP